MLPWVLPLRRPKEACLVLMLKESRRNLCSSISNVSCNPPLPESMISLALIWGNGLGAVCQRCFGFWLCQRDRASSAHSFCRHVFLQPAFLLPIRSGLREGDRHLVNEESALKL